MEEVRAVHVLVGIFATSPDVLADVPDRDELRTCEALSIRALKRSHDGPQEREKPRSSLRCFLLRR